MAGGGRLVASVLVALAAHVPAPAAAAVTAAPLRPQADTSAEEARLLEQVANSLDRKRGLDAKVAELDSRLRETQSDLRNAQNRLYALTIRLRTAEGELNVIRQRLADAHEALRDQAIAAYTGASDAGRMTSVMFQARSFAELATKQSYRQIASETQAEVIARRQRLEVQANDTLLEVSEAQKKADEEQRAVASHQARLQAERDAEAAVRYQLSVEIANHDTVLREVVSRRDEFEAQARELLAQSEAVAEQLGRRQQDTASSSSSRSSASARSSSGGRGGLDGPLATIRVSSGFGYRVHPVFGSRRLHTGVDLNATTGTPIRAASDGVVVSAGWLGGYGNATVIDHGGGLATLYAHQSAMDVGPGQDVSRGQVIGRVGCTGTCTGPHLHYEVRINGNPVDPSGYL